MYDLASSGDDSSSEPRGIRADGATAGSLLTVVCWLQRRSLMRVPGWSAGRLRGVWRQSKGTSCRGTNPWRRTRLKGLGKWTKNAIQSFIWMQTVIPFPSVRNKASLSTFCEDMMNEISIEVDGNTIAGSYEVNRGMIMVSGGKLGSKSAPLGGPATTELLARRLLRELYVESRPQII